MKKRLISLLLTVVMLMSLCTVMGTAASADDNLTTVTLSKGDTVLSLCQKLGVDFFAYKNLIMKLNGFTSESQFSKLAVGQQVVLPASAAAAETLSATAASASTVSSTAATTAATTVATTVGTTLPSTSSLTTGQALSVPAGDSVAYYLVRYTLQSGDTVGQIYANWGLSYKTFDNQIKKLNNISSYNSIAAGKTLILPTTNPAVANSAYYTVMSHIMKSGETAYDVICSQYGMNFSANQSSILALNNTTDLSYIQAGSALYIPISGIVSTYTTVSAGTGTTTTTATSNTSANYNLVSQTTVNGSFDLMVDGKSVTTAQAGKTVSIVATPDIGYGIDTISVTKVGDSSTGVAVNNNSFVMPSYSVIVNVTFKQVAAYSIKIDSSANGSVVAMINGTATTKGYVGSKVTVRAIPKAGFMLDNVRVTYNKYKDSVAVENNQFVMPGYDVCVTATFVTDPDYDPNVGNVIYVDASNCEVTATVGGTETKYAKKGDVVSLNITPYTNYTVQSVKVYNSDFSKLLAEDKNTFTMPDGPVNVVVDVKTTAEASFAINIVDPVNGEVAVSVNDKAATSAKVGETVVVHGFETKPAYNYLTTVYKTNDPSVAVATTQNDDGTFSFVMPDYEVTVRVKFYTYYNVKTHASNGQYGTYGIVSNLNQYVGVSKAGAGVELKVGFSYIASGYSVSEIMLIYADGSTYTLEGTTFIMPDCDVTVKVKFAKSTVLRAYAITENDTDKASVYPHWGNTYTVGGKTLNDLKAYKIDINVAENSNVTVYPTADIGYQFDKFVINYVDTDGNFQTQTKTYLDKDTTTLKYQFTMPKIKAGTVVELRVYFKEVPTYSITADYINASDPKGNVDNSNADHHMGTFSFLTVYDLCDHAAEDTKLYIRSYANSGYKADLSGVRIYKVNNDGSYTDVTSDPDVNYDPTNYSFFMPAYDLKIYVPFTESMFWVKLEKSFDSSKGLARGEITLLVGDKHFTEETLTLTGSDKNNTRMTFEPGTVMRIVNTSATGYVLNSDNPFSIYRVDSMGNYISGDLSKSLMVEGSVDTFVLPSFNVAVKANYDDEVVTINKADCEHGSFTVPSQVAWNAPFDITEIYPDEGFQLSQILLTYTDFSGTPHKDESIDISSISGSSKTIQLKGDGKPQSDVTVKVVFTAVKNPLSIKYTFSGKPVDDVADYYNVDLDVIGSGSVEITRDTGTKWSVGRTDTVEEANGIPSGSYVKVSRSTLHYDANFSIDSVTVTNNGFPVEVTEDSGYYYFYMPYVSNKDNGCVITVNYTNLDEYSFYLSGKATGSEDVKDVTFKVNDKPVTTAKPGEEITVVFTTAMPDEFDGKTLAVYAVYTDSDNVTHREKMTAKTGWKFTVDSMPVPATVAIEYAYESGDYVLTYDNGDGSKCEFWVDGEQVVADAEGKLKVTAGKTVTVKPIVSTYPTGQVPVSISTDVETDIDGFTFVMPEANVTVTVNFSAALTIAMNPDTVSDLVAKADYTITTSLGTRSNESQYAYAGDHVTVTITPKSGYIVDCSGIKADKATELKINGNTFTFTVGTESVTISGWSFAKVEKAVTFRYTSDSAYNSCAFYKNTEDSPMTSGESTVGVNDVITVKNYDGYKITAIKVTYLTFDGTAGASNVDLTNGTITITSVPDGPIDVELKLEKMVTAYSFDYPTNENSCTLTVTNNVMSAEGKINNGTQVSFELKVRYDKLLDLDSVKLSYMEIGNTEATVLPLSYFKGKIWLASDLSQNKDGLVRVYNGYFTMPNADTTLTYSVSTSSTFTLVKGKDISGFYKEAECKNSISSCTLGTEFYVKVNAPAEGKRIESVKATYYVHNTVKSDTADTKTIDVTKNVVDGTTVYKCTITEPSAYNSVTVNAVISDNTSLITSVTALDLDDSAEAGTGDIDTSVNP